ncbi:MAG: MBL fold metallo-hydrolase [Pseudomonadales bacterium]|nr:MBL fold metallo-hydrolase [Pseudomonadales bacterium]
MYKKLILKCLLVFGLLASGIVGCSGHSPERVLADIEIRSTELDWNVISTQPSRVKFQTLLTGSVTVLMGGMLNLDDPKTGHIKDEEISVDVYAHWIRHPIKGDFLIDTGLNKQFLTHPQGSLKGLIASFIIKDSTQHPNQDILSQITRYGITPRGVFLTHAHSDHSAGIIDLPKDIPYYLGKNGSLHNYPFIMYTHHFEGIKKLLELDFDHASNMANLGKVIDIWGDASLFAISSPGHTKGHVSYLVHADEGWILLTGDASHTRWGFENGVIPGWSEDRDLAAKSLHKLMAFSDQNPNVRVIFGHQM